MKFVTMNLADIKVGENYSREEVGDISSLAESIRTHGLIEPLIVDKDSNLVAGFRRYHAMLSIGLTETTVSVTDSECPEILNLIENLERTNLTYYQECVAIRRLFPDYGEVEVAEALDRSRTWARSRVRIWELPDFIIELVKNGTLTTSRVNLILNSKNREEACRKVMGKSRDLAASSLGQKPAKKEVQEVITICLERGQMAAANALRFSLGDITQEDFWDQLDK